MSIIPVRRHEGGLNDFSRLLPSDPKEETWGVAVASKFPAVGAIVPWAQAGAGALATQALANVAYGTQGLEWLRQGMGAPETVLTRLTAADAGRESRQAGIVDRAGHAATFTGKECLPLGPGGLTGAGYAIPGQSARRAGCRLQHGKRLPAYRWRPALPACMPSLMAGETRWRRPPRTSERRYHWSSKPAAATADTPTGCSITAWMTTPSRVEWKSGELICLHRLLFRQKPGENERIHSGGRAPLFELQKIMARLGYLQTPPTGLYDKATREAFRAFTGNENFEERCDPDAGWIDAPVYRLSAAEIRKMTTHSPTAQGLILDMDGVLWADSNAHSLTCPLRSRAFQERGLRVNSRHQQRHAHSRAISAKNLPKLSRRFGRTLAGRHLRAASGWRTAWRGAFHPARRSFAIGGERRDAGAARQRLRLAAGGKRSRSAGGGLWPGPRHHLPERWSRSHRC